MALASYSQLKNAVADWLARSDLTSFIPEFVTLFEARANRVLRVRRMEALATLAATDGTASLPDDFLALRRLTWLGDTGRELEYVHPSYLKMRYPDSAQGTPSHYTIEGDLITVKPVDETDLELSYYAKMTALTDASSNWLFNKHPDAYLFGSLAEAHGFNVDLAQLKYWEERRDRVFDEIRNTDFLYRGGLSINLNGATP